MHQRITPQRVEVGEQYRFDQIAVGWADVLSQSRGQMDCDPTGQGFTQGVDKPVQSAEIAVDQLLVEARAPRQRIDAKAGKPLLGQDALCCGKDRRAGLVPVPGARGRGGIRHRQQLRCACHQSVIYDCHHTVTHSNPEDNMQRTLLGAAALSLAIAFNLPFALLASSFDYPDILRRPAGEVLDAFAAGGAPLILHLVCLCPLRRCGSSSSPPLWHLSLPIGPDAPDLPLRPR